MPRKTLNRKSKRSRRNRKSKRRSYKMRGGYGNCVYQVLKNNSEFCSKYNLNSNDSMENFLDKIREIQRKEIDSTVRNEDTINYKIFQLTHKSCPGGPNS
jgi:hypothetical protein